MNLKSHSVAKLESTETDDSIILAELEDLLRSMPPFESFYSSNQNEVIPWCGRLLSIASKCTGAMEYVLFKSHVDEMFATQRRNFDSSLAQIKLFLHQRINDLQYKIGRPLAQSFDAGQAYDYFDNLRKLIESAKSDILFVDPYLDTDFITKYMPYVTTGTNVRLLASRYLKTLVPAAKAFSEQHGISIEVRSADNLHDRYVFIDKNACHYSGASFKDGAKKSQTTMGQMVDILDVVLDQYENTWTTAKTLN